MHTFTALYDTRADAEAAQRQLETLGILDTDGVQITGSDASGSTGSDAFNDSSRSRSDSGSGSGFWGSLKRAFVPEDREVYEHGVRSGCYLLTVHVDDQNADQVERTLESTNAVNIDEREDEYRSSGAFSGSDSYRDDSYRDTDTHRFDDEETVPIVQEQLKVGKRQVERGGVRVRSYQVEEPVHEQVSLHSERVEVERRPVDRALRPGELDDDLLRDRDIELRETAEEAVVAKEARVIEEVGVRKESEDHVEEIDDTVRHTEVDVERLRTDQDRRF